MTAAIADQEHDGLPPGRRILSMLAIQAAIAMTVIDSAIANIALPVIGRDLHASASASIWVVNSYQIALTVLLLPLARLGEVIGYRRQYLIGITIFIGASLGCALSTSLLALTLWRVVQGAGAAGVLCITNALIRHSFPARMLGRAMGLGSLTVGSFYALGPGVAAAILSFASWHWLFGINVPFGIVTIALAWRVLPKDTQMSGLFDLPGAVLSVIAIGFVLAGVEGIAHGINPVLTIAAFVLAAVVGASLLHRERAVAAPIFPVDLLRVRVFRLCVLTAVLSFMAQMLAYTALPFMLERSHGMSQVQTGVSLMAWPAALALTAPVAGWLSDRYPPMRIGAIGLLLYGMGLVLLIRMPAAVGIPGVALRLVCCGIGLGLFQSPNMRLAISATPLRRSGAAGGMTSASRLFGQTIGSALVALAYRLSDAQGGQYALWGGIAATVIAAAISVSRARERLPADRRSSPLHEPDLVE